MSKSSQMTEAANINARTRPLPRKNFRILFMAQRLPLQPALPLRLLTLSGEAAEAAAADQVARKRPPPVNTAGSSRPRAELSAYRLSVSACVAFHSRASVPAQLALEKPCSKLPFGHSGSSRFQPPDSSTDRSSHLQEPMSTFLQAPGKVGAQLGPRLLSSQSAHCNSTPLLIRKTFQAITLKTSFSSHLPRYVRVCLFSEQLKKAI